MVTMSFPLHAASDAGAVTKPPVEVIKGLDLLVIIGAAGGGGFLIILICLLGVCCLCLMCCCKRSRKKSVAYKPLSHPV